MLARCRIVGLQPDALVVLTGSFFVVVVVVASVVTLSGGDDTQTASDITPSERTPVKVVIAGTNDAQGAQIEEVHRRRGTFKATGAITDHGSVTGVPVGSQ